MRGGSGAKNKIHTYLTQQNGVIIVLVSTAATPLILKRRLSDPVGFDIYQPG